MKKITKGTKGDIKDDVEKLLFKLASKVLDEKKLVGMEKHMKILVEESGLKLNVKTLKLIESVLTYVARLELGVTEEGSKQRKTTWMMGIFMLRKKYEEAKKKV